MNRWTFSKVILHQGQLGYLFLSNRDPNAQQTRAPQHEQQQRPYYMPPQPTTALGTPQALHQGWVTTKTRTKIDDFFASFFASLTIFGLVPNVNDLRVRFAVIWKNSLLLQNRCNLQVRIFTANKIRSLILLFCDTCFSSELIQLPKKLIEEMSTYKLGQRHLGILCSI